MLTQIITALTPVLPWVFVALVAFALFVIVYLFRKFSGPREEAEAARRAVQLELSTLGRLGRIFRRKTDVAIDANALTISKPIPAVPPPEKPL